VQKDWQEQSPEDPDRFSDSVEVLLSAKQFEWLTKQCERSYPYRNPFSGSFVNSLSDGLVRTLDVKQGST
jgi:hypothetical protein